MIDIFGIEIIEDARIVTYERGPVRTWRQRLLSTDSFGPWYARPWRPWAARLSEPRPAAYLLDLRRLLAHPDIVRELKRVIDRENHYLTPTITGRTRKFEPELQNLRARAFVDDTYSLRKFLNTDIN